MFSDFAVF